MPSRWDAATHGWSRRVFHYPLPTLMSRNFRLPCTIELQPLSLTLLKMRKVELHAWLETHQELVVDEDSSVTAMVIEMLEEGLQRRGR